MQLRSLLAGLFALLAIACTPVAVPAEDAGTSAPEAVAVVEPGSIAASIECAGVLTSQNQEGPYYSAGSPQRASLIEEGMPGVPILISGRVFNSDCAPVDQAVVDFWQADAYGAYDNAGYTLRGRVVTDEDGFYSMETIEPGLYTGRPPHIHVKVFDRDGRELLTTQIYFPGSEQSADVRAAPDLLATYLEPDQDGRGQVVFNFVVEE